MRPRRLTPARAGAALLLALPLAVAVAAAVSPGRFDLAYLPWIGQASAQAVAAVACAGAARAAGPGMGRWGWGLLAGGQALWFATAPVYALAVALGAEIGAVSLFDLAWLGYYVPTLAAIAGLYHVMQPEPGWLGALDAMVLTSAALLASWVWVLGPIADAAEVGTGAVVVNALYPALDVLGLCLVGWLAVRRWATPRWMLHLTASFAVGALAGVAYMHAVLADSAVGYGVAGGLYAVASLLIAVAARRRRRGGRLARAEQARATTPPSWSVVLPFAPVVLVAAILLDGGTGPADRLAVAIILVVVGRLAWSLLVLGRLSRRHEELMRTDPLTGAHNRLFLAEELGRLAARARREDADLAALSLDLDGFKAANDRHGHAVGDALLTGLVREVGSRLREGDVLCRVGGDEFVALLPGTDLHGALSLAARLLDGVERARAAACPDTRMRGSIGVAAARGDEVDPDALVRRADEAMYAGKRGGGGRVVAWRPGLDAATEEPGVLFVSGR